VPTANSYEAKLKGAINKSRYGSEAAGDLNERSQDFKYKDSSMQTSRLHFANMVIINVIFLYRKH
jgi:hypothetical protein